MKTLIFVLISMFIISCSPKIYELADGRMVSEKKFERVNRRAERRLSNPDYVEKLIKNFYTQDNKELTDEEKKLFTNMGTIEVIYDSTKIKNN